jgi:hypothetical protein
VGLVILNAVKNLKKRVWDAVEGRNNGAEGQRSKKGGI